MVATVKVRIHRVNLVRGGSDWVRANTTYFTASFSSLSCSSFASSSCRLSLKELISSLHFLSFWRIMQCGDMKKTSSNPSSAKFCDFDVFFRWTRNVQAKVSGHLPTHPSPGPTLTLSQLYFFTLKVALYSRSLSHMAVLALAQIAAPQRESSPILLLPFCILCVLFWMILRCLWVSSPARPSLFPGQPSLRYSDACKRNVKYRVESLAISKRMNGKEKRKRNVTSVPVLF